jgi:hypothetical protein
MQQDGKKFAAVRMLQDIIRKNSEDKDVSGELLKIRDRFKARVAERQAAAKARNQ